MAKVQMLTAREAAETVRSGDTIAFCGCENLVLAESVAKALGQRFQDTGEPAGLTEIHPVVYGMGEGLGIEHLAQEGMIEKSIGSGYSYLKTSKLSQLINENKILAYCVPMGTMYQILNNIAAGLDYTINRVGLNTFVDPRIEGGCMNTVTPNNLVSVIDFQGEEHLCYRNPRIDVSFIRGTTADEYGNLSLEEEPLNTGVLPLALAAKASGGKVIAQVKRMTEAGSLHPRSVVVPGVLIDAVVVDPEQMLSAGEYNAATTGAIRMPLDELDPLPLDYQKVILRRAAEEVPEEPCTINLGVGIPTGIPRVLLENKSDPGVTFIPEHGSLGGVPGGRAIFGTNVNPEAIVESLDVFRFFRGGSLDMTFLGCGQVDLAGNVNVSKFNKIVPGCGGFIDITHSTRKIVFCGSFSSGGLEAVVGKGTLRIVQEGKYNKIVPSVEQITLSAQNALRRGQQVTYVMERAVFELGESGLVLTEIAPGIDLHRDILDKIDGEVSVSPSLKTMNPDYFS